MREEIIQWHNFTELSKENQAIVINETRQSDSYLNYPWYECIDEDFRAILELLGYYNIETYFTGFYSQGDGASFDGRYLYAKGATKALRAYAPRDEELNRIALALQDIQKKCRYDLGSTIDTNGRYSHEMTMSCLNWSNNDLVEEDTVDEYTDEILELHRDLARWYYKALDNYYDCLNTDETIAEHLEASCQEWSINEDGEIL